RRWGQAVDDRPLRTGLRKWAAVALAPFWLASVVVLLLGWHPGTYLALELGWALPPIALQLIFGADILWRYRRPVAIALAVPTLFLAAMDAVAISAGTWTISPDQSLHFLIAGVLPLEEFIFFLITNTLIVFGITLLLAKESQVRLAQVRARWQSIVSGRKNDAVRRARR
ncbi:MAG: lycopene cyclase domain-containing protein, partial [Candidatus Promineifilaceae bacterium]|nr:lycopene cyclase domain-containing protein [Candidatus Promineifilaceae bacterium]